MGYGGRLSLWATRNVKRWKPYKPVKVRYPPEKYNGPTHLLTEIVLHPPSGLLFLACSSPANRRHWIPALTILEEDKHSFDDYIATYDATTGSVTRLTFKGFPGSQGYSSHGLDVVPSGLNPEELYVYAVNHRKPVERAGKEVGANSVVEI